MERQLGTVQMLLTKPGCRRAAGRVPECRSEDNAEQRARYHARRERPRPLTAPAARAGRRRRDPHRSRAHRAHAARSSRAVSRPCARRGRARGHRRRRARARLLQRASHRRRAPGRQHQLLRRRHARCLQQPGAAVAGAPEPRARHRRRQLHADRRSRLHPRQPAGRRRGSRSLSTPEPRQRRQLHARRQPLHQRRRPQRHPLRHGARAGAGPRSGAGRRPRAWTRSPGLRKDNTGYDIKSLFLGAEGTLGVITAACLKLYPALRVPRHRVRRRARSRRRRLVVRRAARRPAATA